MTALLTDNLSLLAGAPNGIKKLRELILTLAVSGKLVPQDFNDEPASELLKRITEEKARLVSNKKIKLTPPLDPISDSERLFDIPSTWAWVRIGDISRPVSSGSTPSADLFQYDEGVPFLKVYNIRNQEIDFEYKKQFISAAYHFDKMKRSTLVPGDVVMNIVGPPLGKVAIIPSTFPEWNCNQAIVFFGLIPPMLPQYVLTFLKEGSFLRNIVLIGTAGQDNISVTKSKNIVMPIPPLAEQHRIVAKVDALMALCDRLEAQQADTESAHVQLVQALLDTLTQTSDAAGFAASWQRLAGHFHTLFTTESSIDALKHTLLQLAVMGKLVQQDSSDESAEKLLERISNQRSSNREKKQKPLADISEIEKPFELPAQWTWTTLPAVGELARGKSRHRPRNDPSLYTGGYVPLVQTGDVARANGIVTTRTAMYNAKGVEQSRLWPAGTMCITIAANIADSAMLGFDACFPDSVVGFIPDLPELDVRYFEFFLRTAKSHLEDFAPSTAQKNINLEILGLLTVPLPPANEVLRIVSKVNQLMALCDQLKIHLTQARQLNEQLASTLVEQAVA